MNTIVKNVLLVVIPSAISAVVSHVITKKIVTDKYESEIIKEIDNFKKEYAEKMANEPKRIPVSQLTNEQREKLQYSIEREEERRKKIEERREIKDIMPEESFKEVNVPMEEDVGDDIDDEDDDLYDDDGNLIGDPNDDDDTPEENVEYNENDEHPFVISQEEYDNDTQYSKNSLKYYEEDKVLSNENDYPLDIEDIIGEESLEHFGDMSGDDTIVYVRNLSLDSDYEVQLVHGSYKHLVEDLR